MASKTYLKGDLAAPMQSQEAHVLHMSSDARDASCQVLCVHGSVPVKTNGVEGSGQQFASSRPTMNGPLLSQSSLRILPYDMHASVSYG